MSVHPLAGRRERRTWTLVASIAIALFHQPCAAQTRIDWVQVTSPHFLVISDGGRTLGRDVAGELELVREIALEGALLASDFTMRPIIVFALQNRDLVRELIYEAYGQGVLKSYSRSSPERNYFVIDALGRRGIWLPSAYYVYFGVLARGNLGRAPTCITRGVAEFWSNTWIEDGLVRIGRVSRGYVQFLAGDPANSLLPVRDALDLGYARRGSARQPPAVAARFDAQCYALLHYVLLGGENETRRAQLRRYLTLLQTGLDEDEALAMASIDTAEWDEALREYHRSGTLSSREFPAPDEFDPSTFDVRRLGDAEALAWKAELLAEHEEWEWAAEVAQSSMRLDPRLVRAREVYADVLLQSETGHDTAYTVLDELLASGNHSYRTPYLRSRGAPPGERESLLRQTVGMDPDYVPALADLADLLIDEGAHLDEAVTLTERAMLIEPTVAAHVHRLGRAFLHRGEPERARAASEVVRNWRPARGASELADGLDEEIEAYVDSQDGRSDQARTSL